MMTLLELGSENAIRGFRGDYEFLSNFYPSIITVDGIDYPTVEHAYQAAKTRREDLKRTIATLATPGQAKRYGRKISPLPTDWKWNKYNVMRQLLDLKFADPVLKDKLLATNGYHLEEANSWGDDDWGVCNGVGQNNLGKILMQIRYPLF